MTHVPLALVMQLLVFIATLDWWLGAAVGAGFFLGREIAQAEYRAIVGFYGGKRANAPRWVGFERRAWNAKSLIDWIAPLVAVCGMAYAMGGM